MSASDIFQTIESPAEGIYKEKGSKFIAFAFPVFDADSIKSHIDELKHRYYDARHHCFAWQLGTDGMNFRANDDGEPSGTGGKPILGQIRSHQLTNLLIVVVRYFGGTKLGTSGLSQAYKMASLDALSNAVVVERTVNRPLSLHYPYDLMNQVMRIIHEEGAEIVEQFFQADCRVCLSVRLSAYDRMVERFNKLEPVVVELD
jgi:uncharacterized YigZ family protein